MSNRNNFLEDLKRGREIEVKIAEALKATLHEDTGTANKQGDMEWENLIIEVKFDERSAQTGNLFVERYSAIERLVEGGPWSARTHDVDLFLYVLPDGDNFHIFGFRPDTLINYVESSKFRTAQVPNKNWLTEGYIVPISDELQEAAEINVPLNPNLYEDFRRVCDQIWEWN